MRHHTVLLAPFAVKRSKECVCIVTWPMPHNKLGNLAGAGHRLGKVFPTGRARRAHAQNMSRHVTLKADQVLYEPVSAMPDRAALITALMLDRPMCLPCIAAKALVSLQRRCDDGGAFGPAPARVTAECRTITCWMRPTLAPLPDGRGESE